MRHEKRSLAALNEHFCGEIKVELDHLEQNKKFKHAQERSPPINRDRGYVISLTQVSNVLHQAALQVGCLVLMPSVFLCQFVDHLDHFWQETYRLRLVLHAAQLLDRRTSSLLVVAVQQTTLCLLTDTLLRRFMVCHY